MLVFTAAGWTWARAERGGFQHQTQLMQDGWLGLHREKEGIGGGRGEKKGRGRRKEGEGRRQGCCSNPQTVTEPRAATTSPATWSSSCCNPPYWIQLIPGRSETPQLINVIYFLGYRSNFGVQYLRNVVCRGSNLLFVRDTSPWATAQYFKYLVLTYSAFSLLLYPTCRWKSCFKYCCVKWERTATFSLID